MFNLLRMDLYRLKRSKAAYICLAILLGMTVLAYWVIWMFATPEGKNFAIRLGMSAPNDPYYENFINEYNTLSMYRDIGMDGGSYSCLLGLVIALFVCMDFNCGFIKNTMSLHRNRWKYIGSKLMAAGTLNALWIAIQYAFSLLVNMLFGSLFPFAGITDTLFYLTWAWLLTTAFTALTIMACIFTRSSAASITAVFMLGSGLVVTILSNITGLFGISGWVQYTFYYNITYGPSAYNGIQDLKVYILGLGFLTLYSCVAAIKLSRKDI